MPQTAIKRIFISYSHKDKRWFGDFNTYLKTYLRGGSIITWSDEEIKPGSRWFEDIKSARTCTDVAVLLVTQNFLASDFIHEHELGPLLKEAERGGVTILWVPIYASAYKQTALEKYQAVLDPSKPLGSLPKAKRDEAWVRICEKIVRAVNKPDETPVPIAGTNSSIASSQNRLASAVLPDARRPEHEEQERREHEPQSQPPSPVARVAPSTPSAQSEADKPSAENLKAVYPRALKPAEGEGGVADIPIFPNAAPLGTHGLKTGGMTHLEIMDRTALSGSAFALVIGISNHKYGREPGQVLEPQEFANLKFAANDARDFTDFLKNRFIRYEVQSLLNEQADLG
jgi:hypothetical protein